MGAKISFSEKVSAMERAVSMAKEIYSIGYSRHFPATPSVVEDEPNATPAAVLETAKQIYDLITS